MFLKNVFTKWKESLEIFKPKNFKLFLLASLNNFRRSLKTIFSYFFWPISIIVFLLFISFLALFNFNKIGFIQSGTLKSFVSISYFILLIPLSLYFILYQFLVTRASIENKNYSYFLKYTNKIVGIFFISLIFLLLSLPFSIFFNLKLSVLFSIAIFFFLDSKNSFVSIFASTINALTLSIYNLPVILTLTFISLGLEYTFFKMLNSHMVILHILSYPMLAILSLLLLSMISIYYTKIKHQEINLFVYH